MKEKTCVLIPAALLICAVLVPSQWLAGQAAGGDDNPDARPPVTKADVRIVQRAREILNSQSEWNCADTRVCRRMQRPSACIVRWKRPLMKSVANSNTAAPRCRGHGS